MKIKAIALGMLATILTASAVFADNMQQNNPAQGQAPTAQPAATDPSMQNQAGAMNSAGATMPGDKKNDATGQAQPQNSGSY